MQQCSTRPAGWAEPEIWFRIVHVALEYRDGTPVAAYREQAVEITLGPNGAFEDGNIGTLTCRVPADRVVSAVPPRRGQPKRPREPKTPRVVELLRKAIEWQALLESGEVPNQALSANMRETPIPRKFSVEGESGFEHVHDDGGPACGAGGRGYGEGPAATVHGRREAAGAARGAPLHEAGRGERAAAA
jgi:hypothetical protein